MSNHRLRDKLGGEVPIVVTPSPAGHMRLLAPTENRTGQRERMPFCTFGLALLLFLILFDPGAPLARPVNGIPGAPEFTPKIVDDSTIQVPIFDRRLHYTGPVWFTGWTGIPRA